MDEVLRFERFEVRTDVRQVLVQGVVLPLGARAYDLLELLVGERDRVVPKDEIFEKVWPGLVVEDNNLTVQISTLRKALGADAITTSQGRGYRFTAKVLDHKHQAPPQTNAGNIPVRLPALYGRDGDLEQLVSAFASSACVTVCGLAGIGKTALAKVAAQQLARSGSYRHGVWAVELADVQGNETLIPALCETLGIELASGQPLTAEFIEQLRHLNLLLVLDNCEHLIESTSDLVQQILSTAADVHVLATSQEALRVVGERVMRLAPLPVPTSSSQSAALKFGAVRMLLERVRSALGSNFEPSPQEFDDLVEICRQLDGVPLALEFASARVPLLGLAGVRQRLHDRLRLLAGGHRATPSRHRSLQAALEWSHQLLSLRSREVLHRLAIFPSGFSIVGALLLFDATDEDELLEHLSILVERSLITVQAGTHTRYRMLETTRAFALECLASEAELETWHERHALVMAKLCVKAAQERDSSWLWQEMPGMRAALLWSTSAPGHDEISVTIATYTSVVLAAGGAIREALDNLLKVQGSVQDGLPLGLRARYWHWLGRLGVEGRLPSSQCIGALEIADAMFIQMDEPRHRQACQRHLAEARLRSGDLERADRHLEEARSLEEIAASSADRMRRLRVEALVSSARGDHPAALRYTQMALTIAEAHAIDRYRLLLMADVALTQLQMGRADAAALSFQDLLLHLDDSLRQGLARAHAASGLTVALIAADRVAEAARSALRSVRMLQQANLLRFRTDVFAWLAAALGHFQVAALLVGVSDAFLVKAETERDAVSKLARDKARALVGQALSPEDQAHWEAQGAQTEEAGLVAVLEDVFSERANADIGRSTD